MRRGRKRSQIRGTVLKVLRAISEGKTSRVAIVQATGLGRKQVGYSIRVLLARNMIKKMCDLEDMRRKLYEPA
jgi:predicted transcriptional regulator